MSKDQANIRVQSSFTKVRVQNEVLDSPGDDEKFENDDVGNIVNRKAVATDRNTRLTVSSSSKSEATPKNQFPDYDDDFAFSGLDSSSSQSRTKSNPKRLKLRKTPRLSKAKQVISPSHESKKLVFDTPFLDVQRNKRAVFGTEAEDKRMWNVCWEFMRAKGWCCRHGRGLVEWVYLAPGVNKPSDGVLNETCFYSVSDLMNWVRKFDKEIVKKYYKAISQ